MACGGLFFDKYIVSLNEANDIFTQFRSIVEIKPDQRGFLNWKYLFCKVKDKLVMYLGPILKMFFKEKVRTGEIL